MQQVTRELDRSLLQSCKASAVQCFTGGHQGMLLWFCVAHVKWGENTQIPIRLYAAITFTRCFLLQVRRINHVI